jgi:hypothetical protein
MRLVIALAMPLIACGSRDTIPGSGKPCDPAAPDCPSNEFCSELDGKCHTIGVCSGNADCQPGMMCDTTNHNCVGGCGGEPLDVTHLPANMLLVLDRSCSMTNNISPGLSKWEAAVAALTSVLTNYETKIRWGMTLFPDTETANCDQSYFPFGLADANGGALGPIATALNTALVTHSSQDPFFPNGPCVTNIDSGIVQAATDPGLDATDRKSYLMLITDGKQSSCGANGGDNGTEAAVMALHDTRHIDTFIVGFGAGTDKNQMNTLAMLGGQARSPVPPDDLLFYQADTPQQLDQAFQHIASLVLSCQYRVDPPPPDPTMTYVFFDKHETVTRDETHAEGWDYDPSTQTLSFYGDSCTRLTTSTVTDVDVVFGCPNPLL